MDERGGHFLPVPSPTESLLTRLQRVTGGGFTGVPLTRPAWVGPGGAEGPPPTTPPGRGQDVPDIVPIGGTQHFMPGGRLPREGKDLQRTPDILLALPRAGHGSDPGGGEKTPPALPQV